MRKSHCEKTLLSYTDNHSQISRTVFRMRHKLLKALEEAEDKEPVSLQDQIELDEKYVQYSHKGESDLERRARKRGEPAAKRGISNDQVCMITGVQRQGTGFIHCWNMGRPSARDVEHISPLIGRESYAFTDGTTIYDKVLEERACHHVVVDNDSPHDSTNHINNVNSFHSAIDLQYRKYRGVAAKYINRYCALFKVQKDCQGMDRDEVLIHVLGTLRKYSSFLKESECKYGNVFIAYPSLQLLYTSFVKCKNSIYSQCQQGAR
ncbi:MAG: IS1595 family transposase [Bulleidia sp.]|nr:IS1595 family transposase [Bulleidia sp.]